MSDAMAMDDYHWLIGTEAAQWLRRVAEDSQPLVSQAGRLRKHLPPGRTHLVLEQVELRRAGQAKFVDAGHMFFTARALQQASDQWVAAYKAGRFPGGQPLADLCCGIGGDLLGLARRGPVTGVDRDPVVALLAQTNARPPVLGEVAAAAVRVRVDDVAGMEVREFAAWHLDPDRRPKGRRTTKVQWHEPGVPVIERLLAAVPDAAVKLAPAAALPDAWSRQAEREWISRDRQCRQLVVWFGRLAEHPGKCRATVLGPGAAGGASPLGSLVGSGDAPPPPAQRIGRYVFDPDPAVRAAGLTGTLAAKHGLEATASRSGYLTGDRPVSDPLLACFEVTDVLPLDLKRLRRLLHECGVGRLEIKKRGLAHEPDQVRRQLRLRGAQSAVLLLAPVAGAATAILARRLA